MDEGSKGSPHHAPSVRGEERRKGPTVRNGPWCPLCPMCERNRSLKDEGSERAAGHEHTAAGRGGTRAKGHTNRVAGRGQRYDAGALGRSNPAAGTEGGSGSLESGRRTGPGLPCGAGALAHESNCRTGAAAQRSNQVGGPERRCNTATLVRPVARPGPWSAAARRRGGKFRLPGRNGRAAPGSRGAGARIDLPDRSSAEALRRADPVAGPVWRHGAEAVRWRSVRARLPDPDGDAALESSHRAGAAVRRSNPAARPGRRCGARTRCGAGGARIKLPGGTGGALIGACPAPRSTWRSSSPRSS